MGTHRLLFYGAVKLLLTFTVLTQAIIAFAAVSWDNGQPNSALWSDAENWTGDVVPVSTNDAWVNTPHDYALIEEGIHAVCNQIIIARHDGKTNINFEITGGTLSATDLVFIGQYPGSEGKLIMSGGTINSGSEFAVGVSGIGTMKMSGGVVNVTNAFKVGRYNVTNAIGCLNLFGGTINCGDFYINDYSKMDIADTGKLVIDGNRTSIIGAYIDAGSLTADGGAGTVAYDYNVTNPGKTTITMTLPPNAINPSPADLSVGVDKNQDLSWTAGYGVDFDVYFGLDLTAVENATKSSNEYLGTTSNTTFNLEPLQRGCTYYWRIDELDASGQLLSTGIVWRFEVDFFDPDDLGPTTVTFDYTGIRNVPTAPAVGVHPRIYFSEEQIPDIRWRLANTAAGQQAQAQITAYVTLMNLGYSSYNRNAAYALDSAGRARIDNTGLYDCKVFYDKLVAGSDNPLDGADVTKRILLSGMMAIRAFDSLMKNDVKDLTNIGKAIANCIDEIDIVDEHLCIVHLAYAYDMAFNQMTQTDRDRFLTKMVIYCANYFNTSEKPYGVLEEAYSTTSNWVALNSFYTLAYLAVQGEHASLDSKLFEGTSRAMHNFLTYGFYPSGAGYEGLGKNYIWATALIAYARQGKDFVAHPHVRAYAEKYLPALMQPFGYAWSAYDSLGGSGRAPDPISKNYWKPNAHDVVGLKWLFPDSPEVDFLWRNYVGDEYDYRQFAPRGHDNSLLIAAIFAVDYDEDNSSWSSSIVPKTFFAEDRGLIHTRSDTTQDATSLQFHCRQNMGGHTNADRLNFNISALGRVWGCYRTEVSGGETGNPHEAKYHSVILIDDTGVPVNTKDGVKAIQPAAIIEFDDQTNITTMVGDATYAYTYEWDWDSQLVGEPDSRLASGWTAVTKCPNDFFYTSPGLEEYHNIDFYNYASWFGYPLIQRMVKRLSLPMDYIYRSASLVRGDQPYVLIVDDVALTDGQSHNYKWQMQLVDDLTIDYTYTNFVDSDYRCDIVLKEPEETGTRRLLVRVLQNDGYTGTPGYIINYIEPRNENSNWPALAIESITSASPNYKVLVYAFNEGDQLPTTAWNDNDLTVSIGAQFDTFNFSSTDGLTRYTFDRVPILSPVLNLVTAADGQLALLFSNGVAGVQYQVITTTNLSIPLLNWNVLSTNFAAENGVFKKFDLMMEEKDRAFFKVVSP